MSDFISRDAAIEAVCSYCSERDGCNGICADTDMIRAIPAADVVARKKKMQEDEKERHVEFISYDGCYPSLCSGTLTLRIDGEIVRFDTSCVSPHDGIYPGFWRSGGYIDDDWDVHPGRWEIDPGMIPEQFIPYIDEFDRAINENVQYGCCGGCL